MLNAHNQQKRMEDVCTALMVLSKLESGQKLGTRADVVHAESGWFTALKRAWSEESRTKTHATLKAVYEDAFSILQETCDKYVGAKSEQERIKTMTFLKQLTRELRMSKVGLSNLIMEYQTDTAITSRFELLMHEVDTAIEVAAVNVPDLAEDDE